MELKLDLHVHSAASPDGRMSVEEIVAAAREKGLKGAAICDHDVLFRPEAGLALPEDFLLIPGEEFSTEYGHILGLFLTEPVLWTEVGELLEGIRVQGGLAVLAHPFERSADEARLAPILPLLDGIEVWNGRANRKNPEANAQAARFAAERGLPGFAGSDAHLPGEIGNGYVTINLPEPAGKLSPEAVKAALLAPGNPVSGQNGRHLDVARSQHTKLKKQRAPLRARLKWVLFAAKCAAEDLRRR